MNRRNIRSFKTWALTGVAVAAIASPAWAQATRRFEIPRQDLVAALEAFGKQGGAEIMFSKSQAQGHATPGVSGDYEPGQALSMLLEGSGLKFRQVNGNTYVVEASDPQSGSAAGDGADGTVQALIVTAQKREEDIQDVPIAISAFTQEDLTRSQVAGGPDLMTQVPNFTFTKTNFSSYSIQIRGIGTQAISATTDAAVAVAFNNTPFIRNRFFEQEFYDLQRVEVLRGPQGTLYGRNATAGVVNIISQKPKFGYEAKLSADVANYNSTRLEGMINLPLVEDKVALRLAGAWTKRDGYDTNQITGNQIDGRDLWSTRVSLRVTPTDRIDANLVWEHFEENDDRLRSGKQLCHQDDRTQINGLPVGPVEPFNLGASAWFSQGCLPASLYSPDSFEAPNGYSVPYFLPLAGLGLPINRGAGTEAFDPYLSKVQSHDLRQIESTVDPEYRATNDIVELQASFDLTDKLTITSETGYNYDEIFSLEDFNRFNTAPGAFNQPSEVLPLEKRRPGQLLEGPVGGIFCDPQIGCSDRLVAVDLSTARSRQFSQELRLASDYSGPFNFSLGANFLRYDTEDKYYVFINTLSMYAANPTGTSASTRYANIPYVPNVSDGHECLGKPYLPDPFVVQDVNGCVYMDPNPIGSLNDEGHNYFLSKNPYKLISYAVFGEAYYQLADNLKVTAGLRWTVDKKEAPRIPSWVLASESVGYPIMEVVEQEWREPTGRLAIDWKPDLSFTDETLLYASYAHGYKAGGSNPPPSGRIFYAGDGGAIATQHVLDESLTKPKTFNPEFVDAFELGAKNTLDDGRMTLNMAAFYYNYKDYQISQIIDRSAVNYNFDAKVWGLEIEADWRPLENLRFGLKLGYENTRVGDGEQAIDIMERNYGHGEGSADPWIVMRPFPTYTENCVLPLSVVSAYGIIARPFGQLGNGYMGPCEYAYAFGWDPLTKTSYVPNPTTGDSIYPGYPGFNPLDPSPGHNNGEGFFKPLGGNELPNAPHYTATLTTDYTIPLAADWLMTLHSDLYYQSEAWTRIFNMEGYDKLKAYTNVNLAAIFTNDNAGWKVMAYIKNVFDRDSITGAFLNSDDTGLTTNVFLTEPRLFGLRVTKEFSGGQWWPGGDPSYAGPFPLTVELGGALLRDDAPYEPVKSAGDFQGIVDPALAQNRDLDRGEMKQLRLTYRPAGGVWAISAGMRFGKAKSLDKFWEQDPLDGPICAFLPDGPSGAICAMPEVNLNGEVADWSKGTVTNHEDDVLADFMVGREVGLGALNARMGGGLQYARFKSDTRLDMTGVPDWHVPEGWFYGFFGDDNYKSTHTRYDSDLTAEREFEGLGPKITFDFAQRLWGDDAAGRLDIDVMIEGGVLFGKQNFKAAGQEQTEYFNQFLLKYPDARGDLFSTYVPPTPTSTAVLTGPTARSQHVTVPTLGASLGLSYEVQRVKISTGYRWERYFDVLDGGWDQARDVDRTLDGPYFKIAVGFGG